MLNDDLIQIFEAGASAAVSNEGTGRSLNPYIQPLAGAKARGERTDTWERKMATWNDGFDWQSERLHKR